MGLESAGMTTVFQCEIDKNCQSVLRKHWPDVPKWDDVSTLTGAHILEMTGGVDVVAWGSPCQDLSLAGKRKGLDGERSGLFHQGIRIIKELRELSNGQYPTFSIWENVVGALSSNGGADFGEVLFQMDEAGACFSEWAVLDAQYFGVPQRRRRVFVTSCFNSSVSERCPDPLFPVAESLSGDFAESKSKRKRVASKVEVGVGAGGGAGFGNSGFNQWRGVETAVTLASRDYKSPNTVVVEPTAIVEPIAIPIDTRNALRDPEKLDAMNRQGLGVGHDGEPSPTVTHAFIPGVAHDSVAIPIQDGREIKKEQNGLGVSEDGAPAYTLDQTGSQAVAYSIREDAKADNFSATEIETARALQALQPSVQSHHAQTFITQEIDSPLLLDGTRVDDVCVYTEPTQTLTQRMGTGGNNVPMVAQEPIVFAPGGMVRLGGNIWEGGPVPTLRAEAKRGDNEPHIVQEDDRTIVIDRAAFNQGENAQFDIEIRETEVAPSLVARGPHAVGQTVYSFDTQFGSNANVFEDQSPTLKASQQSFSIATEEPAFTMRDREGKPGGGKDPLFSEDTSLTLQASNDQKLFQPIEAVSFDGYNQKVEEEIHRSWRIGRDSSDFVADLREPNLVVRRLTPLECERLMGWPDDHTRWDDTDKEMADTNRYKMCGNGVASPVAQWIATHLLKIG